jgi:NADH dehydrogenase [ubiquinone] 1 alpha subcomplex assembly factor 1
MFDRRIAMFVTCGTLVSLASACSAPAQAAIKRTATPTTRLRGAMEKTVAAFHTPEARARWSPSSDAVMGGISDTRIGAGVSNTLVFSGVVRLENNGGFSTISSTAGTRDGDDLSGFESLALRVKGDGKTYQLWLYTGSRRLVRVARFETKAGAWQTTTLPFAAFEAENGFGQRVSGAGAFVPGKISGYRLLISDKQAGPFAFEIEWIKAIQ